MSEHTRLRVCALCWAIIVRRRSFFKRLLMPLCREVMTDSNRHFF